MQHLALVVALVAVVSSPAFGQGRTRGRQFNKAEIERIIKRLERNTDAFKKAVDRQLDHSVLDGTRREDRINDRVSDLERATDRLRDKFDRSDDWSETRDDVEAVVQEARNINGLFGRVRAYSRVSANWAALRNDINTLAGLYKVRPVR
jgi:chromosome segregation ATPase